MSEMGEAVLVDPEWTGAQLLAELKTVLEKWPLYRKLQYAGADNLASLPTNIQLFCKKCGQVQRWETPATSKNFNGRVHTILHRNGFQSATYSCRNCTVDPSYVKYYFYWTASPGKREFFKVGQFPPLEENVPETLEQNLDADDLRFYKNAIRLRNSNLGIGAVAYLRRVVENRINDMLDVLAEAAREHHFAQEELSKIEAVKASRRFDEKIDYAAGLLPDHLRPAGKPNPIDRLHDLASEGLHSKSEEECVDIFDRTKAVFEYVFGNLRVQVDDAKAFLKSLESLQTTPRHGSKKAKGQDRMSDESN